jgi:hypothetical protein
VDESLSLSKALDDIWSNLSNSLDPQNRGKIFFINVHFKVRTGPQKGSSGEENTQSTLHMAIGPYRILYVLPALLGVCVV